MFKYYFFLHLETSMSYMILDILRFVGFFLVIYFSFTITTTYVYMVYDDFNKDSNFVEYKNAFKYFFWALIRTGNPEFAEIKTPVINSTLHETSNYETKLDGYCLQDILENNTNHNLISFETIKSCFYFVNESLPSTQWSNCAQLSDDKQAVAFCKQDEGLFFVIGNVLWASYQFLLVIVLLSILRAKMINTYQSIIQEADMQWKFFR